MRVRDLTSFLADCDPEACVIAISGGTDPAEASNGEEITDAYEVRHSTFDDDPLVFLRM